MKRNIIFWIFGVLAFIALVVVISAAFYLNSTKKEAIPSGPITFPSATSTTGTPLNIPTTTGTSVTSKDFIHNGTTIEDGANKGTYYLAGTSGYCNPDGTCPVAGSENEFNIVYDSSSNSFTIGLLDEPLGKIRSDAENYLQQALGISKQNMCALHYYIGTTSYVNATYSGENLGFSYCPGAVPLPQ